MKAVVLFMAWWTMASFAACGIWSLLCFIFGVDKQREFQEDYEPED